MNPTSTLPEERLDVPEVRAGGLPRLLTSTALHRALTLEEHLSIHGELTPGKRRFIAATESSVLALSTTIVVKAG